MCLVLNVLLQCNAMQKRKNLKTYFYLSLSLSLLKSSEIKQNAKKGLKVTEYNIIHT